MRKKHPAIFKTRIGKDIVAEFVIPPTATLRKKGRVAIIAKGAPSMPGGTEMLAFLAQQGFYAILPRYRGTWESGGRFLGKDPTDDIRAVLDAIKKPLVNLYDTSTHSFPTHPSVYLMVGSFGGPAGMFLSSDRRVKKVFAYAPVVDWRVRSAAEPIETLNRTTKRIYGEGYRLDRQGWNKLKRGNFYNPATQKECLQGDKIHIFQAKDDAVVAFPPVARFAKEIGAHMTGFKSGGHGGASMLTAPRVWKKVMRCITEAEKSHFKEMG